MNTDADREGTERDGNHRRTPMNADGAPAGNTDIRPGFLSIVPLCVPCASARARSPLLRSFREMPRSARLTRIPFRRTVPPMRRKPQTTCALLLAACLPCSCSSSADVVAEVDAAGDAGDATDVPSEADVGEADGAPDAPEADDTPRDDAREIDVTPDADDAIDAPRDDAGGTDAGGPCPPLMALVGDAFCIDLYEGRLQEQASDGTWSDAEPYFTVGTRTVRAVPAEGSVPQGYISGTEAQAACERSGKRLCTSEEWLAACQGPAGLVYPYGDDHVDGACNDHYAGGHPVVDFFGTGTGVWDMAHMKDPGINRQPGTVAAGGAFAACESSWGVFDLHGNLHEWVADADGTFRGGFYADAALNGPGCLYRTTAHEPSYHDYSTGFRCCADR